MVTFTLRGSFRPNEVNKAFLLSTHQNVCVTRFSHRYAHQNSLGRPPPLEKTLSQQLHLLSLCRAQGHAGPQSYHDTSSRKAQPALVQVVNDLRLQHPDRFSPDIYSHGLTLKRLRQPHYPSAPCPSVPKDHIPLIYNAIGIFSMCCCLTV